MFEGGEAAGLSALLMGSERSREFPRTAVSARSRREERVNDRTFRDAPTFSLHGSGKRRSLGIAADRVLVQRPATLEVDELAFRDEQRLALAGNPKLP